MIGGSDSEDIMADAGQVKLVRDSDNTQNWFNVECISFVSCWKTTKALVVISMKILSKNIWTSSNLLEGTYQLQLSTADLHFCPCLCPRQ